MNSNERLEKVQAAREALVAVGGRGRSVHGDLVAAALNRYLAAEALRERDVDVEEEHSGGEA
jgi:hypothetical protein